MIKRLIFECNKFISSLCMCGCGSWDKTFGTEDGDGCSVLPNYVTNYWPLV